jgi:hypothetical protein
MADARDDFFAGSRGLEMKVLVKHKDVSFRKILLSECGPLGDRLQAENIPWHFHVLTPDCEHNPFRGNFSIVIENQAEQLPYIADAGDTFPDVDRHLVALLHGDDILDANMSKGNANGSPLVVHLKELQSGGISWHHHMFFPDCVFNPMPGKWVISIESSAPTFTESYLAEPVDVLREVELLCFSNLGSE